MGVDILFLLLLSAVRRPMSAVRRPALHLVSAHNEKSIIAIITKFGLQDYWVSSLPGIAFGEGSSIAIRVIAT